MEFIRNLADLASDDQLYVFNDIGLVLLDWESVLHQPREIV
jgi:hypothetical protein